MLFRFTSSEVTSYSTTNHYTVNIGATLGQIVTGGGADHLKEQLACIQVPSLSSPTFINLEHTMGTAFEATVSTQLLTAGQMERQLAIAQGNYHNGVPAITVVVDTGWSKRSHKHSYNANSGVGVIFGAATKALLFIGVRNKNIALYVPSTTEMGNQFQLTIAFVIGLVVHVAWKQTSFLKGFGNLKRCMASGIYGSLEMEIAPFTTVWLLVCHHMEEISPKLSVPTMQSNATETDWKHYAMIR